MQILNAPLFETSEKNVIFCIFSFLSCIFHFVNQHIAQIRYAFKAFFLHPILPKNVLAATIFVSPRRTPPASFGSTMAFFTKESPESVHILEGKP